MKATLIHKCDLFAENKKAIHKNFKWDSGYMSTVASAVFASMGQTVDIDGMKEAERIIKEHSKVLSEYRDHAKLPILVQMVRSRNPEGCLEEIKAVYEKLMAKKFLSSTERMMAALVIVGNTDSTRFDYFIERTLSIHKRMKSEHRFLTDEMDMPYAAILAVSDIPEDSLICDMEQSFASLKSLFPLRSANNLQSLSHILSLYQNAPAEKTARVKEFCDIMKSKNHKIPGGSVLPIYGAVSMMSDDLEETANELIDTYEYLKSLKGLGFFSIDSDLRYVYASMMVLSSAEPRGTSVTVNAGNHVAMTTALLAAITMQVCMIVCMTTIITMSVSSSH